MKLAMMCPQFKTLDFGPYVPYNEVLRLGLKDKVKVIHGDFEIWRAARSGWQTVTGYPGIKDESC